MKHLNKDLYSDVWTYSEWAEQQGLTKKDTGIDLVAKTWGTDEYHAIQCKFYDENHKIQKSDIDSFFTASGKKDFSHRIIVSTALHWTENAEKSLENQHPPVSKIDLHDLETSQIDWIQYHAQNPIVLREKKSLRPHQQRALKSVVKGLTTAERGKMIMACGTGKTFTSLKIAETVAGRGKRVLFLLPSLALLSQTLTEWTQEAETPLHSFAVCSDSDVGKKKNQADDDSIQVYTHELRYPATTNAARLAKEMQKRHDAHHMSVVFSTYHSINVISEAQQHYHLPDFDLIVCDEAHRTTGATFDNEDESNFVKVHDNSFIHASKRLYMTATPRIYGEMAKATAENSNIALCSMDDPQLYGRELHVITFSEAVKQKLLVDYKVIVLAVDESHVNRRLQQLLADENNQLKVDDAAKIIGCWKALSKQDTSEYLVDDPSPMRRAVAFCQVIEPNKNTRTHKVSSKNIASMFFHVVEAYKEAEKESGELAATLICKANHVDGSMNASEKEEKLKWLKTEPGEDTCRILSNVRCLSEGVDVPALDAVLFLTPRNSQVDVVQSVGRVMRLAEGKKRGYVILPVVIPAGVEPHKALDDNKTYKVVWQVLQALRAHDDRFDAMINKMDLIGNNTSKMEVIAITDKIQPKTVALSRKEQNTRKARNKFSIGEKPDTPVSENEELPFEIGEIERAIYAKVVKKCGNAHHWEDWANDIAKIARTHIDRIKIILEEPKNTEEISAFSRFTEELRDDLNNAITDDEIIEMLAQHLITKPVFDALFEGYSFAKHNPMSQAMQNVLDTLQKHHIEKEADVLQAFYESVKMRADDINTAEGRQKIVVELYDKFFRNAFPRMTERLGIVYTPVEVVDFIIHSVNDVLKQEFNQTLGDKNVHIIDPFTGTGTFITRLLQSGLISKEQLPYKYQNEIHANELVLLAYYIAAINIESVYHDLIGGEYQPFNGICLTDTFQMYEKEDLVSELLEDNSERRKRQKALDIKVIMGNPPYSSGQDSANDNNANIAYPSLDTQIRDTYAANSTATNKNALYDSYIRAIRWASDRIGDSGVIGFVTNAGFIEANNADGLRQSLAEEFSSIYIFHLRGNARTSGELRRREKDNVFGQGTRTSIAISLLVKNPDANEHGKIYLHDIGDYLTREQKLEKITELASINGINQIHGWQEVVPDKYNDWLNQRDDRFNDYISLGDKKDKNTVTVFENYSRGVATSRDAWCYNSSEAKLIDKMKSMIDFYNEEVDRYQEVCHGLSKEQYLDIDNIINTDSTEISWNRGLKNDLRRFIKHYFESSAVRLGLYRPYTKSPVYFSKYMNDMVYQIHKIFPNATLKNKVICLTVTGTKGFSVLISNLIPDLHLIGDAQCFPLNLYEPKRQVEQNNQSNNQTGLFEEQIESTEPSETQYTIKDGITDAGLAHFQKAYPAETLTKEDIFYYIYGLLHSEDYRNRYADNLSKELPRIPCVKKVADFWAFTKAGRQLADWHLNYETVAPYPVKFTGGNKLLDSLKDKEFRVTKMKFVKKEDKSTVIYNPKITMTNIPLEAYDYIVNGKPALEWVMERQSVTTHKDSGIVNDANDWAIETMHNPRYPLELFQRVITVSLETMKIVRALPKLDI